MKNPIKSAAQYFDDTMMYGAEKTLKAWNFTTGKTKADLANLLVKSGGAIVATGMTISEPLAFPIGLWTLHSTMNLGKTYNKMDKLEREAAKQGLKDINVEKAKKFFKGIMPLVMCITPPSLALSIDFMKNNLPQKAIGQLGIFAGIFPVAFSGYVIRADDLPPGKNLFQRIGDKIEDIKESYSLKPGFGVAVGQALYRE